MKLEKKSDSILIDGRYQMYSDGCVYDTQKAQDIPNWIFEFRDFVLKDKTKNYTNNNNQINNRFLLETFKKWYSEADAQRAKQKASFQKPETLDYEALSLDIDESKFGEYTLNPDTQQIDFETARLVIIDLPQFVGKKHYEVMKYIIDTYAGTHHIPGLEYWKWIIENPDKASKDLKDGNWHYFPGSLLRGLGGRWRVSYVRWIESLFSRDANWLDGEWLERGRVVLLEK